MKEAYTQLEFEENSRDITCFNTEAGIYRHKLLVYGINKCFEIFQGGIEQSFEVIKDVKFIADDIYATSNNRSQEIIKKSFLENSYSRTN